MALRIRVPPLVDVLFVDDPAHMAALNNHESVSRDLLPDGGWLNAFVHARTYGTFTVGDTPLAVFSGRRSSCRGVPIVRPIPPTCGIPRTRRRS